MQLTPQAAAAAAHSFSRSVGYKKTKWNKTKSYNNKKVPSLALEEEEEAAC